MTIVLSFQIEILLSMKGSTIIITPRWKAKSKTILGIFLGVLHTGTLAACFDLLKFQIFTLTLTHMYV